MKPTKRTKICHKKTQLFATKKQLKIMRKHWKLFQEIRGAFFKNVYNIETNMSKECGIENMEFFMVDNDYVGIGNGDRTMKLVHDTELQEDL